MKRIEQIEALDQHFQTLRPSRLNIDGTEGRYIYSKKPGGLFEQFDPENERVTTIQETIRLRLLALNLMLKEADELRPAIEKICEGGEISQAIKDIRRIIAELINDIWKVRLTTSTHMVRANDEEGKDTIFFHNGLPFESSESARKAMNGELSDGGIQYTESALEIIRRNTAESSRLPFSEYLAAQGGNFSGKDFLNHPVFSRAVGNQKLMEDYVWGLQILNIGSFYNQGMHSGWRPGEMRSGFGRPIALGFKGETFYPPNNSTVDHCALVVPRDIKEITE